MCNKRSCDSCEFDQLSIGTPDGELTAYLIEDINYPGIGIRIDGKIVAIVEYRRDTDKLVIVNYVKNGNYPAVTVDWNAETVNDDSLRFNDDLPF